MKTSRRTFATVVAAAVALSGALAALSAHAQARKDSVVIGMVLEPPGLDPTIAPAAAIGEIVHYNILEGLTKVAMDGAVTPLLAESWSQYARRQDLHLQPEARASSSPTARHFDAGTVKFSFDRAKAAGSTNKAKKAVFDNISSVVVHDPLHGDPGAEQRRGDAALPPGREHRRHPAPEQRATRRPRKPVGTGPLHAGELEQGQRGDARQVGRLPRRRQGAACRRVTFRFINDPAAQVAALLAGDIDGMPRFGALQALKQFQGDKRFTVEIGSTSGKGILAINNRKKPFDDVRVRRAITHAIDRQAFIDGAQEGLGRPIGSHFAPTDLGYLDLTKSHPHDPEKAKALLREAGVTTPLNVTLTLPPPQYARKGGEIIAAQLAKVGIIAKIENVEWAQWLAGPFKGNFDLTIINHVEPLDYATAYADPNYYFGYDSARFRGLVATLAATSDSREKARLWRDIQRQLAEDAVNA